MDFIKIMWNSFEKNLELLRRKSGTHSKKSGVADLSFSDDITLLNETRRFIDFLPMSNAEKAPERFTDDPIDRKAKNLDTLIPENANNPYDIKELILTIIESTQLP